VGLASVADGDIHRRCSDGVCVFPFQLEADSFGVTVSCPEWAKQGRVGCIDYHVYSEADCLASVPKYGTPRWMRSAATQGDCLAYGTNSLNRCSELKCMGSELNLRCWP
jgi:hypothetical protein